MPVPFCQGWQHNEFQVNTELSNSGVECLKAGQGRFAFKPEWTICGLIAVNLSILIPSCIISPFYLVYGVK